ncbi:hypothetical protein ACA106_07600 [Agrobacterium pusense]|uniref:hypothetical protein n=1 Tax=Agrobacterium pusense TaxID=648995 RepID=UPI0035A59831
MVAMMRCPFADRIAPIAISMTVAGPGTIGAHPWAGMEWRAADSRFFDLAMQSRPSSRRRKKADGGRCGLEIEAAIAPPVFGQTRSIEFALGVIFQWREGNRVMATTGALPPVYKGFSGSLRNSVSVSFRARERFPPINEVRVMGRTFVVLAFHRVLGELVGPAGMITRPHSTKLDDSCSPLNLHGWLVQRHRTSCSGRCGVALLRLIVTAGLAPTGPTGTTKPPPLTHCFHDFVAL